MKRIATFVLLLAATALLAGTAAAGDKTTYGEGIKSETVLKISEVIANAGEHLGEVVCVEGPVVGVCKGRGCWIEIASDQEFQKIQVKVEDGIIVFPVDLKGKWIRAEGVLSGTPMDYEEACDYLESEASCQGEKFNPDTVPADGIIFYRIQGTGAVVIPPPPPPAE